WFPACLMRTPLLRTHSFPAMPTCHPRAGFRVAPPKPLICSRQSTTCRRRLRHAGSDGGQALLDELARKSEPSLRPVRNRRPQVALQPNTNRVPIGPEPSGSVDQVISGGSLYSSGQHCASTVARAALASAAGSTPEHRLSLI